MSPKDFSSTDTSFKRQGGQSTVRYAQRVEQSVALAKEVAGKLDVDLFDERRRGQFRQIVQNCTICAYQNECRAQVMQTTQLDRPYIHCRNQEIFSQES